VGTRNTPANSIGGHRPVAHIVIGRALGFRCRLVIGSAGHMCEVGAAGLHIETVGAGPPLVLLPGWALQGGSFRPLLPAPAARVHPEHVARLLLVCATPRFTASDDWPHAMAPATLAKFGDELTVAYRLTLQRFLSLQVQGSDEGRATLAALRGQLFARGEPS